MTSAALGVNSSNLEARGGIRNGGVKEHQPVGIHQEDEIPILSPSWRASIHFEVLFCKAQYHHQVKPFKKA